MITITKTTAAPVAAMITIVMSISAETPHTLTESGSVPALELDGPGCVSSAKSLPLSEPLLLPL